MADTGSKIYLLGGNGSCAEWWQDTMPHFQRLQPIPVELPGFGDNPSSQFESLDQLANALIDQTEPGQQIFAVGVNGLVVLHALVRRPQHFRHVILLAPVGAFLWERNFVKVMQFKPLRHTLHWLLSRYPKLLRRKFTKQNWPDEYYRRIANGYRKCRAFSRYFDIVTPHAALDLFEWITTPIDLVWGNADGILDVAQTAAWDSILPRADLAITIRSDWGHYPYLDDPSGFAKALENFPRGFPAHTKGGRLQLAQMAGLPVPKQVSIYDTSETEQTLANLSKEDLYAVRSSGATEDHIDHSHAGRNTTFLRVPLAEVPGKVQELLETHGLAAAVVQQFIEPKVSGVAFCRWSSLEIEYVSGHLEDYISGRVTPQRCILAKLGGEWQLPAEKLSDHPDFPLAELERFLRKCLRVFHYHPSDMEWAWDGRQFYLLQLRPVTSYDWRRCLTSANLDELLPAKVSRIMEHGQRQASLSIGRIYALWDSRVLSDHEPFTIVHDNASYINVDLFLTRMYDWGLPSQLLASEIGGAVPKFSFSIVRFLASLPTLLRMRSIVRRRILKVATGLQDYASEFDRIMARVTDDGERPAALANWFARYYLFIVQSNMIINACLTTAAGSFLGKARTVYADLSNTTSLHRLRFESDPATPRGEGEAPPLQPFPKWSGWTHFLHWLGMPGLGGRYFEVREWFRDNNMRLFFRLHHALKGSEWLLPHAGERCHNGTFWQSGGDVLRQGFSFVIYPGKAEGVVGEDILIVHALEPGRYEQYKQAKAVIARTGGRLSHGATLLRELRKPSAVLQELPQEISDGTAVIYSNGEIHARK